MKPSQKQVVAGVVALFAVALGLLALKVVGGSDSFGTSGTMTLVPGGLLDDPDYQRALRAVGFRLDGTGDIEGNDCSRAFAGTGFEDIRPGAPVVVTDEDGTTIARTDLGPGTVERNKKRGAWQCVFTFSVEVPKAKFYRFEVSRRGQVQKSFGEMKGDGWMVSLTLG